MNKPTQTHVRAEYSAPQIELTEVTVETGFATSGENSLEEDYDKI